MAILKTSILEKYHQLCIDKAMEFGCIDFVVQGGLICEQVVEAFDVDGNVQFRFSPPSTRISTEHWEFLGQFFLYEKEIGVARGAFVWLEKVSDYLCLATAGAPVKMEPFRDLLSETHKLPFNHPKEVWFDEVKIGRVVNQEMLTRANTFLHSAEYKIAPDRKNSYQRALWWFRHGANIEVASPLLAYICFFNSLEILLQNEKSNINKAKPKENNKTKEQFSNIFGKDVGKTLYQVCYSEKDDSLLDIRNDIDHGKIVELGSGMLRVLKKMVILKALVVDLALFWIGQNQSVGGCMSQNVLEQGLEGLAILSQQEAKELGYKSNGTITI
ncbi:MAG: hypothetical protein Q8L41_15955 [Anaerolineales bacterium]|nr:hypothetical protein [Anaerolineales bacterium]